MTIKVPGYTTIGGSPGAILKVMQDARVFGKAEGDEYIESIQQTAWRCFGIKLQVEGNTYEERAESLLKEMGKNNMIIVEEEE